MKSIILTLLLLVACGSSSTSTPPPTLTDSVVIKRDGSGFLLGDGRFSMQTNMQPDQHVEHVQKGLVTTINLTEPTKRVMATLGLVDSEYSSPKDIETLENAILRGNNIHDVSWFDSCVSKYPCRFAVGAWHVEGHIVPSQTWFQYVAKQKRVYVFTVYSMDVQRPMSLSEARDLFETLTIL
jgi:hypothetical protein